MGIEVQSLETLSTGGRGIAESVLGFSNEGASDNITPQITDDTNLLADAESKYPDFEYELLANPFEQRTVNLGIYNGDTVTLGKPFDYRYMASGKVKVVEAETVTEGTPDFIGIQASTLDIPTGTSIGKINLGFGYLDSQGRYGFCGGGARDDSAIPATVGTNNMGTLWDFMPKGGRSGDGDTTNGIAGGVGFSGGGGGGGGSNMGGIGGGVVFIVAESIVGGGTINARGGDGSGGGAGGGGGGIIIILTKAWSGTVGLDVSFGGSTGPNANAQVGSYAILRIETDGSLTLMVHSENGISANLNGQTPVNGADASIAF